ncbi:MAG: TetR/AcrR family transcriptional regulator [Lachnospira sp.]|nr:TetR/AcrR family transcriptional regulator [Lachnospira sp.]
MNFETTKDRIIYESLRLFAEKGFDGVSMREIAAAVGMKAASLYSHFKGKEAIYTSIVDTMKSRYNDEVMNLQIDGNDPSADVKVYEQISSEQLYGIGRELFVYFVHDEYTRMYRKMLTIGQFQNEMIAQEYSRQYYDEAITYQRQLFTMLAQMGNFKDADYEVMALHFYAPIYTMITICDRQPEREDEMLELLRKHIEQFVKVYVLKN